MRYVQFKNLKSGDKFQLFNRDWVKIGKGTAIEPSCKTGLRRLVMDGINVHSERKVRMINIIEHVVSASEVVRLI